MFRLATYKIILFLIISSCHDSKMPTKGINTNNSPKAHNTYDFNSPDTTIYLDTELREISGLTFNKATNQLQAVCDEKGIYYNLNPHTANIESKFNFYKDGDYEGIERFGEILYIAKSNGDVFEVRSDTTIKYKTILKSKNDIEGLCLLPDNSGLLLACKAFPLEEYKSKTKAVYTFDFKSKEIIPEPYLKISIEQLTDFYNANKSNNLSKFQQKDFINRIKDFSPSALAIHPHDQSHYILSARGSVLLVYGLDKNLQDIIFLNDNQNPQPEGICFNQDATLFMTTEGKGLLAKLFIFNSKK